MSSGRLLRPGSAPVLPVRRGRGVRGENEATQLLGAGVQVVGRLSGRATVPGVPLRYQVVQNARPWLARIQLAFLRIR
ncbi:hypothetical protein GCM10009544_09350 [Streptomyces stramineus]|uniref:Uncharacterized protein n=1 Tax=Streptomyces stramineus TaxID=173861 RepID=A0ABN0ZIM9_9ACTN